MLFVLTSRFFALFVLIYCYRTWVISSCYFSNFAFIYLTLGYFMLSALTSHLLSIYRDLDDFPCSQYNFIVNYINSSLTSIYFIARSSSINSSLIYWLKFDWRWTSQLLYFYIPKYLQVNTIYFKLLYMCLYPPPTASLLLANLSALWLTIARLHLVQVNLSSSKFSSFLFFGQ